ncbi:IRK-interacting protein-like [Silene latifolia]|uniref:IRK-interacting protein-like n=1 Tax=Silene latifolia TaxID=37657 RepID=UPI003D7771A4
MAAALNNNVEGGVIIDRQEIKEAIAKAVELRALHAALKQGNSPAHLKLLSSVSSSPPPPSQFSSHDYPIFTPSYEDEPLPGYVHLQTLSQTLGESWEDNRVEENRNELPAESLQLSNYTRPNVTLKKGLPPGLANMNNHICPGDDTKSVTSSCTNHISFIPNSPGSEFYKSRRRNSLGDFKSVSSCNNCKPAIISTDHDNTSIIVPLTDSHAAMNPSQTKSRGLRFSWLFPRLKRRPKNDISSPVRTESEVVSQVLKGFSAVPIEALKKELIDANQKRDAALREVSDMRSSFGELRKKLETLESYCEELQKALLANSISKRGKLSDVKNGDGLMPVSEEVMIEGFLQVVSEARLSVKQFCKTLLEEIDESDEQLSDNLNLLLKPYKLSLSPRYSKAVSYHLEAIINQTLYQDFENCIFQKNGTPKFLDPQQNRLAEFQSFAALRNLSWNEVLKKGTKYYSEEFSKFCDQKMSCIILTLNWTRPWSETLLQSFFVAAKCIWLLHLLAFSFYPTLTILRVEESRAFDRDYMEDIFIEKQKMQNQRRVKVMVMPGFYVQDKILRCKVLCRYKSVA